LLRISTSIDATICHAAAVASLNGADSLRSSALATAPTLSEIIVITQENAPVSSIDLAHLGGKFGAAIAFSAR
jgi:hypothetical protein